jgi:cytochrome c biogenesis protein CcmG, thiol:disulfide interchange protein DsbE
MNRILFVFVFVFVSTVLMAQGKATVPSVSIKKLDGSTFNTSNIKNSGKPILISFWATWCKPCVKELSAIFEKYDSWQKETGVVLYAVSVDDSKSSSKVAPFVNGKGWEYEVLLDPYNDFKRAMNVVNVPHTFLIDGKGNVVYQHTTYADGDEVKLGELIKKVAKGESIEGVK